MTAPIVSATGLSKWYGDVIGLNQFSVEINPGITGIVGPNGSGKSTFFKTIAGLIRPSVGDVKMFGERPWGNAALMEQFGFCPDYDNLSNEQTPREFLAFVGGLHGMKGEKLAVRVEEVITIVGMQKSIDRKIDGFSKGMRQRMKIAGAMVHDPKLLLLDEPLSGTDPLGRQEINNLIQSLHKDPGHSIIVSSHVLHEVERLTRNVVVIYNGRAVAVGAISEIRGIITTHPHRIIVESEEIDKLAKRFVEMDCVVSMEFHERRKGMVVQVSRPDEFFDSLPGIVEELGCNISRVYSLDDNLESVFRYLVGW